MARTLGSIFLLKCCGCDNHMKATHDIVRQSKARSANSMNKSERL